MELDWENLLRVEASPVLRTIIRFYRWDQPTVSLGKHQQVEKAVDLNYCEKKGIPIVHRPTGGRAVFHKDEITYAVVSNNRRLFPLQSISGTYAVIAEALRQGLRIMGIEVESSQSVPPQPVYPSSGRQKPCFVTPSRHELLYQSRKLVGSAQRRLKRSFLQHGSIALTIDYPEMGLVLDFSEDLLRQHTISLSEAARGPVSFGQAARCLQAGFEQTLK
jgi:lipoate-protein ligase A